MVHHIFNILVCQREVVRLRKQVKELSWDTAFDMWTRPAFLHLCDTLKATQKAVIFIDLSDIGQLNLEHGYSEIDRRVRFIFSAIKCRGAMVGRWYSGDEIVVLCAEEDAEAVLYALEQSAIEVDIGFTASTGVWQVKNETIHQVVERLSRATSAQKLARQVKIA